MSEQRPPKLEPPARAVDEVDEEEPTSARPTVDEMSEWSFPASDPPATWTWETPEAETTRNRRDEDGDDRERADG
jgi:hypothetical protein